VQHFFRRDEIVISRLRRVAFTGLFMVLACGSTGLVAQQPAAKPVFPVITKVDPPNWWVNLPAPMLLVHGENLNGATVHVIARGVTVAKQRASPNGHWLFVWLDTTRAVPETIRIVARNSAGSASYDFLLASRQVSIKQYQGFSPRDVMYLIMTDRFANGDTSNDHPAGTRDDDPSAARGWHGGDFRGIEQHLDYLQQLGVTTVWTTPVYDNTPSPQSYHGYSATDMYAVDPHFGTLADYRHLAAALHQRGMKIVLDTVPNHVGPNHPWVDDEPTPDWFHGTLAHHSVAKSNFSSISDPHAAPLASRDVIRGWFANALPDLNQENPLVSKYLIQNAIWWIETAGLDGLRLDTFPYVGRGFWHDYHAQLHTIYPHLTTVGEIFNADPTITAYFAGGVVQQGIDTGLGTPFDFPMYFALRDVLVHGAPMTRLEDTLRQDRLYPHPQNLVTFFGNHDTTRFLGEKGATVDELKLAFALLATMRGMPQIYSGDEIAMQGGEDPDNRRNFPGGFPDASKNAFSSAGRTPQEQDTFAWASMLFGFRKEHPVLQTGEQQNIFADDSAFAFVRTYDVHRGCSGANQNEKSERLLIVVNNSDHSRQLSIETQETAAEGCAHFASALNDSRGSNVEPSMDGTTLRVLVNPHGFALYRLQ
jgi:glycosidase